MDNIKIGTVISNADPTKQGMIAVHFDGTIEGFEWVWYSSPYSAGSHAGFGAIPEVGTRVLCCKPKNDPAYHFLSCTTAPSPNSEILGRKSPSEVESTYTLGFNPKLYNFAPIPMSYGITTPLNNQILLKDDRNEQKMNPGIRLKSAAGKVVALNDAPGVDAIILKTGNELAGIKITQDKVKEGLVGANSIYSACKGSSTMVSREGNIVLEVGTNGEEIILANKSSTKHGQAPYNKSSANIRILSDNGNIIIETYDVKGGIFIDNKGGPESTVQVRSRGNVGVFASEGINMRSTGDVNIKGANVNIQSDTDNGGTIELNPTDNIDENMKIQLNNWDQMKDEDHNYEFFDDTLEDLENEEY